MKLSHYIGLFVAITGFSLSSFGQGLAVNTTGAAANSSAALDVSSTTQGMLTPRMTAVQRTAISTPATGLLVYQTDGTKGFYYYDGAAWAAVGGSSSGSTTAPTGKNPGGLPYTVSHHNITTVGTVYFCPTESTAGAASPGFPSLTTSTFVDCHPTLTALGSGHSSNFPMTVTLRAISYSNSVTTLTAGGSLGSCVINVPGGSCVIDQAGATLAAGSGITVEVVTGGNPTMLNTAFSCD